MTVVAPCWCQFLFVLVCTQTMAHYEATAIEIVIHALRAMLECFAWCMWRACIVGALSGCRGMAWFSRLCVRLTGLSQLRHGKIPFSHMEGVPTLCPKIPIYTPGRFAFPFLILFLAYIGACADWRACPALSKVLEAIGGKEWGWVCSGCAYSIVAIAIMVRND